MLFSYAAKEDTQTRYTLQYLFFGHCTGVIASSQDCSYRIEVDHFILGIWLEKFPRAIGIKFYLKYIIFIMQIC